MKKVFVIVFLFFAVLTLTACDNDPDRDTDGTSDFKSFNPSTEVIDI